MFRGGLALFNTVRESFLSYRLELRNVGLLYISTRKMLKMRATRSLNHTGPPGTKAS